MKPITIAIAEDHATLRQALVNFIEGFKDFKVVFEANNGKTLIDYLETNSLPDICILDLSMPVMDGYDTLKNIRTKWNNQKVLILSTFINEFNIIRLFASGANGVFSKEENIDQLHDALKNIYSNGFYGADYIPKQTLNAIKTNSIRPVNISEQEMSFLKLCCSELSYLEISEKLKVGKRTVDGYRENLFRKLNVNTRAGLIMFAINSGIVLIG